MTPSAAASNASSLPLVAVRELVAHRAYLVRFAQRRLRDAAQAEDAVHDVFEAVISGRAAFAGRAALRTWLTGVLKHKIVDQVRRQPQADSLDGEEGSGAAAQASPHAGPEELAAQRERLRSTLARIEALPPALREVMQLRVLEERDSAEVCARLSISEDNLFVRLHRARKQLLC